MGRIGINGAITMDANKNQLWTISLYGGLQVQRPNGLPVTFRTRKSGGIIAILALTEDFTATRTALAEALWPGIPREKQLVDLRQALKQLRNTLGDSEVLQCSRTSVWLDRSRFRLYERDATTEVLLPEMLEPWFAERRSGLRDGNVEQTTTPDLGFANQQVVSERLISVLEWTARFRPRQTLEIARSVPELVEVAGPAEMARLLNIGLSATDRTDPLYSWGLALQAMANGLAGNIKPSIASLRGVLDHAKIHKDRGLFIFASFYLSAYLIVSGELGEAMDTMNIAKRLRLDKVSPDSVIRLRHGIGITLIHCGHRSQGLKELRSARALCSEMTAPYERAYLLANLAWFEATCGDSRLAESVLVELLHLPGSDCQRMLLTSLLAQGWIAAKRLDFDTATSSAQRVLSISRPHGFKGFTIYACELLALVAHLSEDSLDKQFWLSQALGARESWQIQFTPWDRYRLDPIMATS